MKIELFVKTRKRRPDRRGASMNSAAPANGRDPRGLRALAHPARQRLVKGLFNGRILTATEAAELVDLTPSAVSHHLRALERWGLARRAPNTGDGRERPWEGTAKELNLEPSDLTGSLAALQSFLAVQLKDFADRLNTFMAESRHDPWHGSYEA